MNKTLLPDTLILAPSHLWLHSKTQNPSTSLGEDVVPIATEQSSTCDRQEQTMTERLQKDGR